MPRSRPSSIDLLRQYHETTKHRLNAYAPGPGFLDWDSQPNPFRRWQNAPLTSLPLVDGTGLATYDGLYRPAPTESRMDEEHLGLFLELALGLSVWKRSGPDRWALRNNPSSGNLHPTEAYLLLWRNVSPDLGPGLYHYAPYEHGLERRAVLPDEPAKALHETYPGTLAIIGFSSIIWREEWKYGARALRYCQLDVGHGIASTAYAARVLGWNFRVLTEPGDAAVAALLGLDHVGDFGHSEPEHPDLLAFLGNNVPIPSPDWQQLAQNLLGWKGHASRLSRDQVKWPQISQVLPALEKPQSSIGIGDSRQAGTAIPKLPVRDLDRQSDSVTLIRKRRSAQRMDPALGIDGFSFKRTLARTLPGGQSPALAAFPYAPSINLVIFVHKVDGLDPGLYALLRHDGDAFRLATRSAGFDWHASDDYGMPLYRLQAPLDVRGLASRLSCHQAIAGHGAFAVAMLADMGQVLDKEGAWAWRRLHWEAGLIGQVLYLEAEAAGLRGTGIGCFFDDEVHGLLNLDIDASARWQVIYLFTVGHALADARLENEPAYAHRP